jgi:hypothetical protein
MDYASGGTTTIKSGGAIRDGGNSSNGTGSLSSFIMEENSVYEIYKNGGSFPTGTYHPNSLISNTGATNTPALLLMSSAVGSYGNYDFDSPGYTGSTSGINANVTVNDFNLNASGNGTWIFSTSPSTSYTMTVKGILIVGTDCVLAINKSNSGSQPSLIKVGLDCYIDGILTELGNTNNAILEFYGTEDAYFYAPETGLENDVSITVNKTGGSAVYALSDVFMPASANSKLTFTSGFFDVSTFGSATMIIQNPAPGAVVGGSLSSHLIGPMRRFSNQVGSYAFPVSNNNVQYAKALITTAANDLTDWTVQFLEPNPRVSIGLTPGIINTVTNYYWNIFRDGDTPADASTITFQYSDLTNQPVLTPSQLRVVYYNGAIWQNMGGAVNSGSITNTLGTNGAASPADPIFDFGDFALGGLVSVVPVDIEYFSGRRSGKTHDLNWKLNCTSSSEVNMILERSADAAIFTTIHSLTADPQRCLEAFYYQDEAPLPGKNFYRLAVKDADGRIKYSRIISLINPVDKALLAAVYPNPASGPAVTAEIVSPASGKAELRIVDQTGKMVSRLQVAIVSGVNKIPVDISSLPAGQYNLIMSGSESSTSVIRFMKGR